MSPSLKLLLPNEYIKDIIKQVESAKNHISIICMVLVDEAPINKLVDALCEAAKRGTTVEVAADIFTFGAMGGFLIPAHDRSKQFHNLKSMRKRLIASGAKFNWLGKTHATIFTGRTHIKWCLVDDIVYSFGGINLYKSGIENNDYMFKTNNHKLAIKLIDEQRLLTVADQDEHSYRSYSFDCNIGTVLIDGGIPGDSIIYRQACRLADQAKKIVLVSQYCPSGRLNRSLKKASAKLYFNHFTHASGANKILIFFSMLLSGNKTLYKKSEYLHAKFMIFEMTDGHKIALTGSHNFSSAGVMGGTREVALQTEDESIIEQLENFWRKNIA